MTTVPKQPIPRQPHVTREQAADRKNLAIHRDPQALKVSDTLDREGPRGLLRKPAYRAGFLSGINAVRIEFEEYRNCEAVDQ